MRRVLLLSPYAGDTERNVRYARACMLHSLCQGEAPFASHLLYTQVLDDTRPVERALGLMAEHEWLGVVEGVVSYEDLGVSPGMERIKSLVVESGHARIIQIRRLGDSWDD